MSNYTGDKTAAEAPALAPAPDRAIVVDLPDDGDPVNAATWAQPLKALADYMAWALGPRSPSSAYTTETFSYRNRRNQRRFLVDHQGFPGGAFQGWQEDWSDGTLLLPKTSTANVSFFGRWMETILNTNCSPSIDLGSGGGVTLLAPWSNALRLSFGTGGSANAITVDTARAAMQHGADRGMAMEWDTILGPLSAPPTGWEIAMGVFKARLFAYGTADLATASPPGAAIVRRAGDTNWFGYVCPDNGGAAVFFDLGVAATTAGQRNRHRIDVVGANVADDSAPHVVFSVDGVVRVIVATDLVNGAATPTGAVPAFRMQGTSAGAIAIGPVRFASNLWAGDVGA